MNYIFDSKVRKSEEAVDQLFKKSGVLHYKKLEHTPFIVIRCNDKETNIDLVDNKDELLGYPDDQQVMVQWRGEWRSDFFLFFVGELREYLYPIEQEEVPDT